MITAAQAKRLRSLITLAVKAEVDASWAGSNDMAHVGTPDEIRQKAKTKRRSLHAYITELEQK